jgi:hypothetical protein
MVCRLPHWRDSNKLFGVDISSTSIRVNPNLYFIADRIVFQQNANAQVVSENVDGTTGGGCRILRGKID